jgi:hypothetical protein
MVKPDPLGRKEKTTRWKYADYRSRGICPSCRNKDKSLVVNHALCQQCYDHRHSPHRKRVQRRLVNRYKEEHRKQGLCDRCYNPALDGLRECQECVTRALIKRRTIKRRTIDKYGGACACCRETAIEFLTIDHINGDGCKERRSGLAFGLYARLLRESLQKDRYQVLCMNCNFAKGKYGYCPHQQGTHSIWKSTELSFTVDTEEPLAH